MLRRSALISVAALVPFAFLAGIVAKPAPVLAQDAAGTIMSRALVDITVDDYSGLSCQQIVDRHRKHVAETTAFSKAADGFVFDAPAGSARQVALAMASQGVVYRLEKDARGMVAAFKAMKKACPKKVVAQLDGTLIDGFADHLVKRQEAIVTEVASYKAAAVKAGGAKTISRACSAIEADVLKADAALRSTKASTADGIRLSVHINELFLADCASTWPIVNATEALLKKAARDSYNALIAVDFTATFCAAACPGRS